MIVVRTGGVAGTRREWRATAEGPDASELETLVEAASWETVSIDPSSRDRFVWSITVAGSAGRRRATVPEARLEGALQELVSAVQRLGDAAEPPASGRGRRAV